MKAAASDSVPVFCPPEAWQLMQQEFMDAYRQVLQAWQSGSLPALRDRRFSAPAWAESQQHLLLAHLHVLAEQTLTRMARSADMSAEMRERLEFSLMQWLEASAPSNFLALNPDVIRRASESAGASLARGMENLLADVRRGRMLQSDESAFELGRNLGVSPGAVVYENPLFQLIQYEPLTSQVHARPLVIVPPCINKFYILDLRPENSLVRHAVAAGHTVFMVSWRNPQPDDADAEQLSLARWDDYVEEGVLRALAVAADISRQEQVNALGFCIGGTLLGAALAVAVARGRQPVAALTLLTTMLDFRDVGVLKVFVDEAHAALRDAALGQGGLLRAAELNTTFAFLRPRELVWSYFVSNYLKGDMPPPFDLLYWNADGTNLPGPFFTWYFRQAYLENRLCVPGALEVCGEALDLGLVDVPAYVYASRDDHIVPWQTAYASLEALRGPTRFVLGSSGHIAGVVNPPAGSRRQHWTLEAGDYPADPDLWLQAATQHAGSWWPDWLAWLAPHGGRQRRAPQKLGNTRYKPLEPAPGRYVMVKAE
ncbi:PHA/PHB synthase family protein [Kerstersia gyiorum]|uniref:Poly(3-hydroxyalkanoate) polymerase n=1 Tax=Kerstersia gyiorum TaxID=206506 RepID=A0A171KSN3_9BURK|nr:class I poly(R)-hydroxyalkanoic acid synthase [Kerstersia gyiorum]KAB0542160.1 class I poly(R)-hydroxyalkanoic acid synthase [Kerstersia gyiorum]KKO71900.1 poly(3-hydroxyalkanoate) polymerase [Kerstersia gyiorum]RZS65018.1 polyhydroxyalkanoate synthase [Kerstersia gyiorum]